MADLKMSDLDQQLLGELKRATDNLQDDAKSLYGSNSRRKDEISGLGTAIVEERSQRKLEFEQVLHAVEESNAIGAQVVEKVDGVVNDVHKLTCRFDTLETTVIEINRHQFDWSKFMKGCISPKGILLISIIGFFITTIFLSILAPEMLSEFFETIPKAKQ